MPNPVQSPRNVSWYPIPEGATAQENDAQMSSSALGGQCMEAPPTPQSVPPAASVASPPSALAPESGARLLGARLTPVKPPPTPQPSVLEATWACRSELAGVAISAGLAVAVAAPT